VAVYSTVLSMPIPHGVTVHTEGIQAGSGHVVISLAGFVALRRVNQELADRALHLIRASSIHRTRGRANFISQDRQTLLAGRPGRQIVLLGTSTARRARQAVRPPGTRRLSEKTLPELLHQAAPQRGHQLDQGQWRAAS